MTAPDTCPICGADVPGGAKACPECGADERTGWSEEAYVSGLNLPDDSFDYDQFVQREFNSANKADSSWNSLVLVAGGDRRGGGVCDRDGTVEASIIRAPVDSRSAGFQPAVSPASSRNLSGHDHARRIGNPRYSRLEVCATSGQPLILDVVEVIPHCSLIRPWHLVLVQCALGIALRCGCGLLVSH